MESACLPIFNEIKEQKSNGLMSFVDVLKIQCDKLVNRMFVTTYNNNISIPSLNQNFIFHDHNLHISPFDIIKELSNISILYLFSDYMIDILERKIGYGIYYSIKLQNRAYFENIRVIKPFIAL